MAIALLQASNISPMNRTFAAVPTRPETGSEPQTPAAPGFDAMLSDSYRMVLDALMRANGHAADLESQLAQKTREILRLKLVVEQARMDIAHLQDSIAAARRNPHQLPVAAMRATGLESLLGEAMEGGARESRSRNIFIGPMPAREDHACGVGHLCENAA